MADEFPYSSDSSVIIQDGNIIWNDQSQYMDANDTIIADTTENESYITAIDSNETQYLSILESSSNITLEDLHNLTLENAGNEEAVFSSDIAETAETVTGAGEEKENGEENAQVVVFTVDGSDDLYGLQLAADEHGNIQKYQFKFRANADGQLEAIPETIQLLTGDDTEELMENETAAIEPGDTTISDAYTEHNEEDLQNVTMTKAQRNILSDIKTELSQESFIETSTEMLATIKEELLNGHNGDNEDNLQLDDDQSLFDQNVLKQEVIQSQMVPSCEEIGTEELHSDEACAEAEQEEIIHQFIGDNCQIEVEFEGEAQRQESVFQYDQENEASDPNAYLDPETENGGVQSEDEEYEIIKGSYLDEEEPEEHPITTASTTNAEPILHEVIERFQEQTVERTNILKHPAENAQNEVKSKRPLVNVKYYVVYPEKENVNSLEGHIESGLTRQNPRSLLRSSFTRTLEKARRATKTSAAAPVLPDSDLFQKRFAKSKEAMRAKLFHNFINRTTVPQAPVRQERQPRKQKIRPVSERGNEEIIVQEVVISANGFVESTKAKAKDANFQVTAVVELSDSEDELNSKERDNQSKQDRVPRLSSESQLSVIEIESEDDETSKGAKEKQVKKTNSPINSLKRRRGRPPKKKQETADKLEISCPHCPKSFPSQNSLNTHLIHHNLENSLKNKARMSTKPKIEYNHKCADCQQSFKNNLLLQRHQCKSQRAILSCSACHKTFKDAAMLNIHKKTHLKTNLVSSTSVAKVSPKKKGKLPMFKCNLCPKVCESESALSSHEKTHKKFLCPSCPALFSSRLLLDTHVRTNCVKMRQSLTNRRLSFKIKKSFVNTPPRRLTTLGSPKLVTKLDCEKCAAKFTTYRALYTHKVQKHGLYTPDKSLMNRPKRGLYKPKAMHGGIPANDRLKRAYAALRMKLQEDVPVNKQTD